MDKKVEKFKGLQRYKPDQCSRSSGSETPIPCASFSCSHPRCRPIYGLNVAACDRCGLVMGLMGLDEKIADD